MERASSEAALHDAYQRYRTAMSTWRSASQAEDDRGEEAAADRLLYARVALYRALLDNGWTPPPAAAAQLERDVALVEAPEDFAVLLIP